MVRIQYRYYNTPVLYLYNKLINLITWCSAPSTLTGVNCSLLYCENVLIIKIKTHYEGEISQYKSQLTKTMYCGTANEITKQYPQNNLELSECLTSQCSLFLILVFAHKLEDILFMEIFLEVNNNNLLVRHLSTIPCSNLTKQIFQKQLLEGLRYLSSQLGYYESSALVQVKGNRILECTLPCCSSFQKTVVVK